MGLIDIQVHLLSGRNICHSPIALTSTLTLILTLALILELQSYFSVTVL